MSRDDPGTIVNGKLVRQHACPYCRVGIAQQEPDLHVANECDCSCHDLTDRDRHIEALREQAVIALEYRRGYRGAPRPTTVADDHIEATCQRCGRPNVRSWHTDSALWNKVMRDPETRLDDQGQGIVCPVCFAELAEASGVVPAAWSFKAALSADVSAAGLRAMAKAVLSQFDYWTSEPQAANDGCTVRIHKFAEVQPEMERALDDLRSALSATQGSSNPEDEKP